MTYYHVRNTFSRGLIRIRDRIVYRLMSLDPQTGLKFNKIPQPFECGFET